jgi:hypothetical protein
MAKKTEDEHEWREPVYVRKDSCTDIAASLVIWGPSMDNQISIKLSGMNESVLICREDWANIKSAIDYELQGYDE